MNCRKEALNAIEGVQWLSASGKKRITAMTQGRSLAHQLPAQVGCSHPRLLRQEAQVSSYAVVPASGCRPTLPCHLDWAWERMSWHRPSEPLRMLSAAGKLLTTEGTIIHVKGGMSEKGINAWWQMSLEALPVGGAARPGAAAEEGRGHTWC